MIALGAFKVAVVAYAASAVTWLALRVRIATLDVLDRHMGALNGAYLAKKYPSILAIALMCAFASSVATIALAVAAIAWAVGA